MKRFTAVFCLILASLNIGSQEVDADKSQSVLLIYEESNKNIDPWRAVFREEFSRLGVPYEDIPAAGVGKTDLAAYRAIVVYGSVMAFATKEPIRDWLDGAAKITAKKTALFVTANRWFLEKYTGQLVAALEKKNLAPVDVVSAATKNLKAGDKTALVAEFAKKISK